MVRGLFREAERETVLRLLGGSVVFLTREVTLRTVEQRGCAHTAWIAVRVYLTSIGSKPV